MSSIPASTNTSASPIFASVSPMAPSSSWRLPRMGDLWVLAWGRSPTPARWAASAMSRRLRSVLSSSTTRQGVSSSSTRTPHPLSIRQQHTRPAPAARRNGVDLAVCVEVDTGMKRRGTAPGEPTLALARAAHETSGIRFEGLMAWEGHALSIADAAERETEVRRAVGELVATAELCQANGLPVRIVSAGGTGTYVLTTTL